MSVITITTLIPHTTMISGSITTVYIPETTTTLQPTLIPDPRQPPPPPLAPTTSRNGIRPWQIGLVVALILILLAICLAAVILTWFRKRRQELRDQEDKVVGSREPWNDPATAAAVMGSLPGGGGGDGSAGVAGVMHPGWHDYNKEAASIAAGGGSGREMSSMDEGYRHVHHNYHPDTRYGPNGELMLVGYTDPYGDGVGENSTDYLGGLIGHGHGPAFHGSDDYGLGLDYTMAGSEIGGAELVSYSGSLAGDQMSYSGSHRYPIPPPLQQHQNQQHTSSNHPQEEQPASPVPRASYEDDYHAAVALRQQLQQQQSRVVYPMPPQTSMSATETSRQPSRDELGTTTSGTTVATEKSPEDYRLNLEKYSKVEHRRQSPHALLVLGHQAGDQDGEIGGVGADIIASPLEGPLSTSLNEAGAGEGKDGKGRYSRDALNPGLGTSPELGSSGGGEGSHGRGSSTPGEETAAARSYLDQLRVDDSTV
ncbi:hypothetical protein BGZ96_002373 [Linnemannia gamsii]|uniref:Uncharacterized protein n=1 Tax=Linnemannia gamsii TaxID=64522 RepID=A0ABQ7K9E4_9FUNG|nr:hypothetical protein BGZ96_002373 [Linnemannia gamsii]